MASAVGTLTFGGDLASEAQPPSYVLFERRSRRAQMRSSAPSGARTESPHSGSFNMSQTPARRGSARVSSSNVVKSDADSGLSRNAPAISSTSPSPSKMTRRKQRSSSTMDPSVARNIAYTRTGRISKARKGVKGAHTCRCGKSYSRAEHLRRHQQNHEDMLYCKFPDCDKTFHRQDLLRRHEEKHLQGDLMPSSNPQSPNMNYSAVSDAESIITTSLSHQPTPAFSPAPTQTTSISQPSTPFSGPPAVMSAPRYTVSQFNHFRSLSQPDALGPFLSADAKTKTLASSTGLGIQRSPSASFSQQRPLEQQPSTLQEAVLGSGTAYTPTPHFEPNWAANAYNQPYVQAHALDSLYSTRASPAVTSHEVWTQQQIVPGNLISPVSTSGATQHQYWYAADKQFGSMETGLALSYPMDLQSMVTPVTDTASPYGAYTTPTEWDQASGHSATPVTVKAELSSPVAILDSQTLSTTLNLHAKQSYFDAFWEYFHPLYPVLHKPTMMEQQRQVDQQQSDSALLLQAAIVICGATFTKEPSRWTDGKALLRKSLQVVQQQHIFPSNDIRVMQAVFLLEAYSQFYSHRAPAQLSESFNALLNQLQHDVELRAEPVRPMRPVSPFIDEQLSQQWIRWIYTHSKQRLFLACNAMMTQTVLYLTHDANAPQMPWHDLALPCSFTLWEASNAVQWRQLLVHETYPVSIADTLTRLGSMQYHVFDRFQSAVLITAQATAHPMNPATSQALTLAVPEVPEIQVHLHAMLMSQSVPLRALLSVAGESWTPAGGRLATHARAAADILGHMKSALRKWVSQGFASGAGASPSASRRSSLSQDFNSDDAAHRALQHALTIIRTAAKLEDEGRPLPFAGEMPLFAATLVIWAIGFEAMQRAGVNPQYSAMTPPASGASDLTSGGVRHGVAAFVHATDTGLLGRLWAGCDLGTALLWRQGADAVMRWTRLRIGGLPTAAPSAIVGTSAAAAARPRSQSLPQLQSQTAPQTHFALQARESQLSELAAGAVNVLRRLESRQNRNWF